MSRLGRYIAATIVLAVLAGACASATGSPTSSQITSRTARPTATNGATPTSADDALGGTVAAGGDLCGLLGPGDFAAAGVVGAVSPTKNSDGPTDAYCVYTGLSVATGSIEFDVFTGDAASTYQYLVQNAGITTNDAAHELPGVNAAGTVVTPGSDTSSIGVEKGQLTFEIDVPTTDGARAQLIALAKLVLARESGLSS